MATSVQDSSEPLPGELQLVLIVDDDEMITEGLAAGLEREGRTLITCNDIESAELVVERVYPSHIVADIRFSGPFAYEGLDFISFAKKHAPETRIILISADAPEALQLEASERGAVAFFKKPFAISELDGMLDLLHCPAASALGGHARVIRMAPFDEIVGSDELRPQFQPIVRLDATPPAVFGYEALARYRTESFLRDPDFLFKYASRKNRVAELEMACMSRALRDGAPLSRKGLLFLNVHPTLFSSPGFHEAVAAEAQRAGVELDRIVLEITEQGALENKPPVIRNLGELRTLGVRFAFDDLGIAHSHLAMMDAVRPCFLKVSQDFGTAFEKDPTRTKIVMNILSLARDFESDLILEGVEDESTALMASHLSIPLGQGFYFARPAEVSELL